MTVRRGEDGVVFLEGDCVVQDAEALLLMLLATPAAQVDWTKCEYLHTAVVQIILAAKPLLSGACGDPWLRDRLPSDWLC